MYLLHKRYEEIKKTVALLYKIYGIAKYPIDVFKLCKKLKIKLVKYSDISEEDIKKYEKASNDGFSLLIENADGSLDRVIYYNDRKMKERVRFTILHEIGHFMLDHKEHSDVAETEANFFAKYAIAPPAIVHLFNPEDPYDIMCIFGTEVLY